MRSPRHSSSATLPEVVEIACYNPATIFNLHPRKGEVAAGADADLVIVDLDREVRINPSLLQSRCDWTIYDGWKVRGWPVTPIKQGEVGLRRVGCWQSLVQAVSSPGVTEEIGDGG